MIVGGIGDLFSSFSDATVYMVMGAVGSLLFAIKLVLTLVMGMNGDADFGVETDVDGDLEAHGTGFSLFSLLSILSFMMGAGWMGLACRVEWGLNSLFSAMIAAGFGFGNGECADLFTTG